MHLGLGCSYTYVCKNLMSYTLPICSFCYMKVRLQSFQKKFSFIPTLYRISNTPTPLLNSTFLEIRDLFNLIPILLLYAYSFLFGNSEQNQRSKLNIYSNSPYFPVDVNFPKEKSINQNISSALHISLLLREILPIIVSLEKKLFFWFLTIKPYFSLPRMVDLWTYPAIIISSPYASLLGYQGYLQCLKILLQLPPNKQWLGAALIIMYPQPSGALLHPLDQVSSNRNIMQTTYIILNFLIDTLKKTKQINLF